MIINLTIKRANAAIDQALLSNRYRSDENIEKPFIYSNVYLSISWKVAGEKEGRKEI